MKDCNFQMACDTSYHINLPEDLLIEILLRSCVESLVRAKCVCKQWYRIIKSPNFTLDHVEYQKRHNKGRLLLKYYNESDIAYALFDDETLVKDVYQGLDLFLLHRDSLHMEGPINGLYCLFNNRDRIALWNPALKEMRALPLSYFYFLPHDKTVIGTIGFGIDPLTHDYKLVLFSLSSRSLFVTVYNFSTNSWRLLDVDYFGTLCVQMNPSSTFLDGTYYWSVKSHGVIAFDMGNETFRKIPGPDISNPRLCSFYLTLFNSEKVALLRNTAFVVDIWVMLEEGIWIKQFSFTSRTDRVSVLGLWKNYGFLFQDRNYNTWEVQAVLFNFDTHELRKFGPIGKQGLLQGSMYYESLVSVDCLIGHKARCTSISDFLISGSNPYL